MDNPIRPIDIETAIREMAKSHTAREIADALNAGDTAEAGDRLAALMNQYQSTQGAEQWVR